MSALALSVLALMGLAFAFDSGDGTSDEEAVVDADVIDEEESSEADPNVPLEGVPTTESPDVEELPPEVITLESSPHGVPDVLLTTVIGTQGDDFITGETVDSLIDDAGGYHIIMEMNLGAGDDYLAADAIRTGGETVDAGDGNDTIENEVSWTDIRGGSGDDVLSSDVVATLDGEAGNDTLSMDIGPFTFDGGGAVLGGSGDDLLQVSHDLGHDNNFDLGPSRMYGGEGADEFRIELIDDVGPLYTYDEEWVTLESDMAQVEVQDFVAGEDALAVDVTSFTEGGRYELVDVVLVDAQVPSSWAAGNWYSLSLAFSGTGETGDFSTAILIRSEEGGVTLDDISILSGVAA